MLHGIVLDGPRSVAYLEDAASRRIMVFRIGDAVAGGTLEKVLEDRIQIRRAGGQLDVLLRDPSKPPAPGGTGAASAAPTSPGQADIQPPPRGPARPAQPTD